MTREVRLFRGEIVEEIDGGNVADPFLMALIRHHSATDDDVAELISFFQLQGYHVRHLEILLKRFGRCIPLMATMVRTTTWEGMRMLRCTDLMTSVGGLRWHDGALRCDHHPLPESVAASIEGRTLGEIVDHPYMPPHLVIDSFEQVGARWSVRFRALNKKAARQESRSHRNKTKGEQA